MVYLKDEKTGVTVEDNVEFDKTDGVLINMKDGDYADVTFIYERQCEALLRGLLRWKLETVWKNWGQMLDWVSKEYDRWFKERSR